MAKRSKTKDPEVLARLSASPVRRWSGIGMLLLLAFTLIYVALAQPPHLVGQAFLLGVGGLCLALAEKMRRATARHLLLTEAALVDSEGEVLVPLDEIDELDRGLFAFKPARGFLIFAKTPGRLRWAPGLWWRWGRRMGVGGVTSAGQAKAMAEILAAVLAERTEARGRKSLD